MLKIDDARRAVLAAALGMVVVGCARGRPSSPMGGTPTQATRPGPTIAQATFVRSPEPAGAGVVNPSVGLPVPTPSSLPPSPSAPVRSPTRRGVAAPAATSPPAATQNGGGETAKGGAEGKPAGEGATGGGGEAVSAGPSVTDPGGLPPSPSTNDPTITQMGQERYVPYRDASGRYQVSLVSTWQLMPEPTTRSVVSRQGDRTIRVEVVGSNGQTALARARADAARLARSVPGYQQLALHPGQIPDGPVVSLIYRFDQGTNAVTGKGNQYIAGRVYVARPGSPGDLAIVTVTAPAPFYGDFTQIFDRVVRSFRWR